MISGISEVMNISQLRKSHPDTDRAIKDSKIGCIETIIGASLLGAGLYAVGSETQSDAGLIPFGSIYFLDGLRRVNRASRYLYNFANNLYNGEYRTLYGRLFENIMKNQKGQQSQQ
ncbi:hypothetical protein ACFLZX_02905 [Nanoarchaeota archaeon]